jgi:hypothetical protein
MAIKAIRKYMQDYYGLKGKFNIERRKEWDEYVEIIAWLEEIKKDGGESE